MTQTSCWVVQSIIMVNARHFICRVIQYVAQCILAGVCCLRRRNHNYIDCYEKPCQPPKILLI